MPRLDPTAPVPGLLCGQGLATALGLSVGDALTLTVESAPSAEDPPPPVPVEFTVAGIVRTGTPAEDDGTVFLGFTAARRLLSTLDIAHSVEVRLDRPLQAPAVARVLRSRLGGHSFRTLDWREINRNLFTSLDLQRKVLTLIVFAMVIVAMFNIVSTLFIIVVDKAREISILKSMGATSGGVLRIFVAEGVTIGAVGTLLGLLCGALACWVIGQIDFPLDPKIYLIPTLPVRPVPMEFAVSAVVALATSLVSTVYPSLKAASLPPAEGLRYD